MAYVVREMDKLETITDTLWYKAKRSSDWAKRKKRRKQEKQGRRNNRV